MDVAGKEAENEVTTITTEVVALVDWLELPEHLTSLILSKLSSITDYARCGAVCTKWLSILLSDDENPPKSFPHQLPLLMVPTPPSQKKKKNKNKHEKKKSDSSTISCSFYRVTDGKIFNRLKLTMPPDRYVRGSAHGWLVTVDDDDICFSIQLINPFFYPNTSTKVIKLPPLIAYPYHDDPADLYYCHLRKVILSADPISNPKDFIVLAIFSEFQTLAFCNPRDKAWTPIRANIQGPFYDIIYYQDKFYAVHFGGTVVVCDVATRTTTPFAPPPVIELSSKNYLVASGGELFQVQRRMVGYNRDSVGFKVYKLQRREEDPNEWVEVKDLCNRVFFVGDNASMSIAASDFPGCKPNCIYYTDDNIESYFINPERGPHDLGIFNLENESFEKHFPTDVNARIWPAPIWIEPTLPRSITCLKRLGIA